MQILRQKWLGPIWIDVDLRFLRFVFQLGFVLVARTAAQIDNQNFAATESHTPKKGTTTSETATRFERKTQEHMNKTK